MFCIAGFFFCRCLLISCHDPCHDPQLTGLQDVIPSQIARAHFRTMPARCRRWRKRGNASTSWASIPFIPITLVTINSPLGFEGLERGQLARMAGGSSATTAGGPSSAASTHGALRSGPGIGRFGHRFGTHASNARAHADQVDSRRFSISLSRRPTSTLCEAVGQTP